MNLNPYDVRESIPHTTIDALEQDPLYLKALEVAQDVQALHTHCTERPRYAGLWDQAARSSSSVALNYAQGLSKLKGHTQSDWLVARAEGTECYATLAILPKELADPIKPKLKDVLRHLDQRILNLPEKPQERRW
jgi:four helix bundle protein